MTEVWKIMAQAIRKTRHGVHTSYRNEAEAALAALDAAGWQCVPKEPTLAMLEAYDAHYERGNFIGRRLAIERWDAMLAAAPKVKP